MTWEMTVSKTGVVRAEQKYNYWRGDYDSIRSRLGEIDWAAELGCHLSVEQKWNLFKQRLFGLVEAHVPMKKPYVSKKKNDWMSRETCKRIRARQKTWQQYRQTRLAGNYREYKKIRNEVNVMVRKDQDMYRKKMLKSFKGNPKRF